MADLTDLPAVAAWRHLDAREGFEVLFPRGEEGGYVFEGHATAVEGGVAWSVRYSIRVDAAWATRDAHVRSRSLASGRELRLEGDGHGGWTIDGRPAPELDGLLDVDLEASAFTNAFPVNRLGLGVGEDAEAPAVYVRAPNLRVARLEQHYRRLADDGPRMRYDYSSPAFEFRAVLVYDESGFVLDYPGVAVRVA
ncbi:MAG: putative glycolipid-binding domain-containing protein [Gaiellaceae bacterium]